ncbi:hypothetical protein SAMN04489867_2557 [Pedococcus dokdonensis]|uniref:Stress response protein n=1 Tax=Pedococcus dokdonensis TaxID=443156 RepID=A0A1H0SYZ9_9MICO|nr:hypothetical protein [Pedococcus dokdonensis]SDP46761.1 hypothetical protein SAMN04489867_2557 [Pedococcus dokdonensis]
MAEESWHEARLIPTSGINGAEEQERRATSALLAVMMAVREFGRGIVKPLGAPAGNLECFIEVPFTLGDKRLYPDGLIRVSRGSRSWTALVEVKTSGNELATEQLENYLDIAREQGFDAVITISNEIPAVAGQHPTKVDKRKLRKVALHHLAWSQVLAEAVMQKEFRGVADPDQAWILGELIRYLEHSRSGALEFDDMGESWTAVRDAVAAGTLRPTDKGIATVVARFDALLRFTSLGLGRRLGTEVVPVLSRKELGDPSLRAQALTQQLCSAGQLSGAIRIPDTVGPLVVTADLRSGRVTCHVDLDAPRDGRPTTRVNWLVRQLKNAPATTRIECFTAHSRGSSAAELLGAVRENPTSLVSDPNRELRIFRVATSSALGTKRGRGRGAFIDSVLGSVDSFYADVLGDLKGWSAAPPKLREASPLETEGAEPVRPASLSSTDYSSQDGPTWDIKQLETESKESVQESPATQGPSSVGVEDMGADGTLVAKDEALSAGE